MLQDSNQGSPLVAIRVGFLFGVIEVATILVVQVLYIFYVQGRFPRDVNFGLIAWVVFVILTGPLLLYYQHTLRRLISTLYVFRQ